MMLFCRIAALLAVLVLAVSCTKPATTELILFDFESESELDLLQWNCRALYALSDMHAVHGTHSLRMDLFPSEYPGLEFSPTQKDWSKYSTFSFDIYNPSTSQMSLSIRIDDNKNRTAFNDRYNNRFVLKPGNNHISLPINNMMTTGTNRLMDLAHIHTVYIFVPLPQYKQTLYIDAIRVTNDHSPNPPR
jgi:hypothetical protein